MTQLRLILKVLLTFLLFGPPIGAAVVVAGIATMATVKTGDLGGLAWISVFGLVYGIPLSYLAGVGPALVAGSALALKGAVSEPPGALSAGLTGLFVGWGLAYLGGHNLILTAHEGQGDAFSHALLALACVVSTQACWWLSRART